MDSIPDQILLFEIMMRLSIPDLGKLSRVDKSFYLLFKNQTFWEQRLKRDHPQITLLPVERYKHISQPKYVTVKVFDDSYDILNMWQIRLSRNETIESFVRKIRGSVPECTNIYVLEYFRYVPLQIYPRARCVRVNYKCTFDDVYQ